MRLPDQAVLSRPRAARGYQLAGMLGILVIVLALVAIQMSADAYTNYLWFSSLHLSMIWRSMAETRAGLVVVFTGGFFLACWTSLFVADAVAPVDIYSLPEHELARRYMVSFGRYRVLTRTVVSFLLALAVGLGTAGQWQHWLMFINGGSFGRTDPQFHRDIGFFVFRLPFLSFLVDWCSVALIVLLLVTAVAHYLNGAMRTSGPSPRVDARATAHLSLLLALMALVRAAAYFFVDRFDLAISSNGIVVGAGYTDVHVRLPALSILALVSMIGFVLLAYNVYHRGWMLPAVAAGLWAFVAIVVGMLYPAMVQWFKVNPSQSSIERPYIERNIAGTRAAFGLGAITPARFDAEPSLKASSVEADAPALSELPLWNPTVAGATYEVMQALHSYYHLSGLATDRYLLGSGGARQLTPVVVGTREVNMGDVPRHSWVAQHLEYTHGYGVVLSPANAVSATGRPLFDISGLPGRSSGGAPQLRQPAVYFGNSPTTSYVVTDTKQAELDYATRTGAVMGHYKGTGGVRLSGFWQRAAFAVRFHNLDLLDSGLITRRSRIMYVENIRQRVARAAPFFKVDTNPYPVVAGGQIYWMVACYTTSDTYPYSEGAATGVLGPRSGLQGQYNYVRNSVEAVVNAYTGKVSFFALDPHDPVLRAWEHTYPGLVQPLASMNRLSPSLRQHLRYPQALLMVLSAMYGRYHYPATSLGAREFYGFQSSWTLAEGNRNAPYVPTYEILRLPGRTRAQFVAVEPLVPLSATGRNQQLAGFLAASSGYRGYGQMTAYELPRVRPTALGPALVASRLQLSKAVVHRVALLRKARAKVLYGPPILVPIEDSFIYIQSIYVSSDNRSAPVLADVAVDLGANKVRFAPSLEGALKAVFGSSIHGVSSAAGQSASRQVSHYLDLASAAYQHALVDGKHFRLGAMQKDLAEMGRYLKAARQLLARQQANPPSGPPPAPSRPATGPAASSSTTSTTTPKASPSAAAIGPLPPRPGLERSAA